MKEYEKLAEDWYNNNAAFDGLKEAYIAGFLKAREMAFELSAITAHLKLHSYLHIIATMRSKQDYHMEKDDNGKQKVREV